MSKDYRSRVKTSNDRESPISALRQEGMLRPRSSDATSNSPHSPLSRWALWVGFSSTAALLCFANRYLDDLTRERPGTLFARLVEEGSGVYAATLLLPLIIIVARRYRLDNGMRPSRIAIHLLAVAVFSAAHTSMNWGVRALLFPAFGHGSYDYGLMPIRYLMEAPVDIIIYGLTVSFVYLFDHYKRARDRELATAQLETRLAEARLQALATQLQPHFLFNTLNMISEMVYESPEAADKMIARLSEMLRLTLRESGSQVTPLARELQVLQLYIELMRGRFQERLSIQLDIDPGARGALVPPMILQTIVENSVRHGVDPLTGEVRITVRCSLDGDRLLLEVEDDGPGIAGKYLISETGGIGLSNTVRRLEQLYGDAQQFTLEAGENGGLLVRIILPCRSVDDFTPGVTLDDHDTDSHRGRRAAGPAQDQEISRARA